MLPIVIMTAHQLKKKPQMTLPFVGASVTPLIESNNIVDYEPIHVSEATFLAGLSQKIHRWFRLTPSFGPELVREMIACMGLSPHDHIHDPFSGAGTTAIESSLEGYANRVGRLQKPLAKSAPA